MLQNQYKCMNFSPNNQKKTPKKSQTCHIFFDFDWLWNAEMATKRRMDQDTCDALTIHFLG